MNNKKLFTKALSISLTAAMVLTMAPISPLAANTAKVKSIKAPKNSKIKVGQTKTITATRKSKKSTKDLKYVQFSPKNTKNIGISVKTSDDTVVSVKKESEGKYTYTGVNTGEAKLTITTRAKTAKGKKLKATLDVSVINSFKVTQTGSHSFTMSTAEKLENVTKRDITVVQEGSLEGVNNAVKEVKIAKDKMSAEVIMEIPFLDQQKYDITFGKEKDSFVASVGAPKAINIKTQTVVVNKPTEIEYAVVDEKGMDVTKTLDAAKITVEAAPKLGAYDTNSKKLTMYKVGETAEVKVVYHTWTYDKTGKEIVVEAKANVTCVEKSAVTVTGLDKWTIAKRVLSWDTDEMKTVIPQGESSYIWVRMKKSDGTTVNNKDNKADFTFEPIQTGTLYVYADGSVYGTREGMEYVKVTYFDGTVKYQYTLPVRVGAKAKATTLIVSNPYLVISKDAGVGTPITVKVLDQYGNEMEPSTVATEKISGENVANFVDKGLNAAKEIRKLAVSPTGKEGAGVYKLTANELNTTITVSSQNVASAAAGYMLKGDTAEIDATVAKHTETAVLDELAQGIDLHFYETKAGLVDKNADAKFTAAKVKVNGIEVEPGAGKLIERDGGKLIFHPVVKDSANNYVVLTSKAGGYNIEATAKIDGKDVVVTTYIDVKNTTQLPKKDETYKIGSVSEDKTTVKGIVEEVVENKIEGKEFTKLTKNENYSMILHKANKVKDSVNLKVEDAFYLDTAALPSFKTDAGATIWVLREGLNEKLKVVKTATVVGAYEVINKAQFIKDEQAGTEKTAEVKITGTNLDNLKNYADLAKWVEGGTDTAIYELSKVEKVEVNADKTEMKIKLTIKVSKDQTVAAANDTLTFDFDGKGAGATVVEALDIASIAEGSINIAKENINTEQSISAAALTGVTGNITWKGFSVSKVTVGTDYAGRDLGEWTLSGTDSSNWKLKSKNSADNTGNVVLEITLTEVSGVAQNTHTIPSTMKFKVTVTLT